MEAIAQRIKRKNKERGYKLFSASQGRIDFMILLTVSVLCAFGLVMIFSASYYYAQHYSGVKFDGFHYLKRQAIYLVIGYPLMLLISVINYKVIRKLNVAALLFSVALLLLVLLIGENKNGGKRWLNFGGISIQPSEVAKFGMMIFMCAYMAKHRYEMHTWQSGMLPMLLVIGLISGLIILQPNMSMAVIVAFIGVVLLFLGGCDIRPLILVGIIGIIGVFALAYIAPYRWARVTSFRNPEADPLGTGYQLLQSFYAIGSGGLFGKGLNNSYQKMLYMTYGESDFIFAILCEELGFVGGTIVILLYAFIVIRGMRVAILCKDRFGSLLAAGISIVFGFQVFVNIAVVTGLMPTTGQALPFISAGGTQLLMFLAAMGVLLSISREIHPND